MSLGAPDWLIHCDEPGCEATLKNNRWSKTKSGWFHTKDGHDYCPQHIPAWVEAWRARKKSTA